MATRLICDNCGSVIEENSVRFHLDTLVPEAGINGTLGSYSQDLCSKQCVLQSDKEVPEDATN